MLVNQTRENNLYVREGVEEKKTGFFVKIGKSEFSTQYRFSFVKKKVEKEVNENGFFPSFPLSNNDYYLSKLYGVLKITKD